MASTTVTTADAILKVLYPKSAYREIAYKNHPFLALVPKNKNFKGKQMEFPIRYGGNQGRSRTFSTAVANTKAGLYTGFFLTRKADYEITDVDTEALLASEGDEAAFVSLLKTDIDGAIRVAANNIATSLYRNFGGARGQIAAGGVSGNVLTLSNPADIVNFEIGMNLVQSTADGTSGALGSGDSTITAVDRRNGKITLASGTNFVALDYLFVKGDFGISYAGLSSWVPNAVPSATAFFGVDRSVDTRLYGQYVDGSALTISESLEYADTVIAREGGMADTCLMNPVDFNRLRISLGSQVIYDKAQSPDQASISFRVLVVAGQKGDIKVVSDPDCPAGTAFMLTMDEWEFCSLGEAPRILDQDGNRVLRVDNADAVRVRIGSYAQLGCHAPSYNAQILLP